MRWLGVFVLRPVATTLLTLALVAAGILAYVQLPVSPLPRMDFPMISVSASLAGASPETMASSVAMPLEQALGGIAGLSEMRSRSSEGSTRISLMFDMGRDINDAARDVQAAINAARSQLPSGLRGTPTYHKVNPSSAPVMTLALTSPTATRGQLYDLASTLLAQRLSQMQGVGEVEVGGSSLPAVRIRLNPHVLTAAGVSLDTVRTAVADANQMRPTGAVEDVERHWRVSSGGQLTRAERYRPLVVVWRDGRPIRLSDVAEVEDGVENPFNAGFYNDQQAVLLLVRREANANIIETVDAIRDALPAFQALLPADVALTVAQDRSPSIRATLQEAQFTLIMAVLLVFLVVLVFLRDLRAAMVPAAAVPASLVATFAVMWSLDYSLNTISLMALIVAAGFVVDDAIVVLENVIRYREQGVPPVRATLRGAREVGFTVVAMSLSLVAVFIPMLLMDGLPGQLFREFAYTLSAAVLLSLVLSLTLTPMMCARVLSERPARRRRAPGRLARGLSRLGDIGMHGYRRSLNWALAHSGFMLVVLAVTVAFNVQLYVAAPKSFFPQQDTGQLLGFFRADRGTSFDVMLSRLEIFRARLLKDPAIATVAGFAGGRGGSHSSFLMVQLKPFDERGESARDVVNRLRGQLQGVPGARLTLVPQQDIFVGGSMGGSGSMDYTLQSGELEALRTWLPRVRQALASVPELTDVDDDVDDRGQRIELSIDRDRVAQLGLNMGQVVGTLNNAFSERQIALIYGPMNQYRVVMSVQAKYARNLTALEQVVVVADDGRRVPLSVFTRLTPGNAPLSVNHLGLMAADSVSFSVAEGVSEQQAMQAAEAAVARIGLPTHLIQAGFEGTGRALQQAMTQQPWLILAALVTMYLVLGILYESTLHPITILSTLPSAGIGALLALRIAGEPFSVIALIGVFLLIGIVKKNAIMMVDFALLAQRRDGMAPRDAIVQACMVRLRPIMMTTAAAVLGALPLVLATGAGVEMRQPLGLTIVGGLLLSQVLTLYTTPVVYLMLEQRRVAWLARRQRSARPLEGEHG